MESRNKADFLSLLLIQSGDVETNPGPPKKGSNTKSYKTDSADSTKAVENNGELNVLNKVCFTCNKFTILYNVQGRSQENIVWGVSRNKMCSRFFFLNLFYFKSP